MRRKEVKIDSKILREAIEKIAGLTPDEMSLFFKYTGSEERSSGSPYYEAYLLLLKCSPEKFFRKLADFIEFKKEIVK